MKNIRQILNFGAGAILFIFSLVAYVISAVKSFYDDGYGKSISYGERSILLLAIVGLLAFGLGTYQIYRRIKRKKESADVSLYVNMAISAIFGFYCLALGLTPIFKGKQPKIDFLTVELIASFVALVALALFLLSFLSLKKKGKITWKKDVIATVLTFFAILIYSFGFLILSKDKTIDSLAYIAGIVSSLIFLFTSLTMLKKPAKD